MRMKEDKITYNRITYTRTNFASNTWKKRLSWEKAVSLASNYLHRMKLPSTSLTLDSGQIWCEQSSVSIQSNSYSEMWIERKSRFTQKQYESFKNDVDRYMKNLKGKGKK